MEYHWSSLINNSKSSSSTTTSTTADYNTPTLFNNAHHAWDSFNHAGNFSRAAPPVAAAEQANWSYPLHYNNSVSYYVNPSAARQVVEVGAAAYQAVALREQAAADRCYQLDPHLTCLKLGKRQYFEDVMAADAPPPPAATKKGKPYYAVEAAAVVVPRCQVEGCGVGLVNAKEYHRRHKVCEMHAKAPVVVVLGIQQRFCQQCSRFHRVGEFDETKRSCRRRLAGHNERRRKTSLLDNQHHLSHKLSLQGRLHDDAVINNNRGECALSLLSSTNYSTPCWTNLNTATSAASHHLPERCSAALRDLIAENRASISACNKKLISNYPTNNNNQMMEDYYNKLNGSINYRVGSNPHGNGAGHVTLDLMEAQNSELGFVSTKQREEQQQECSELWKVPLGYR
ncbi:hypothetical protein ACP275_02G159900 [Erythranthe tilingii]